MSENKVIGTFREKRGDDHYRVVTSHDGEVIGIEQYDAIGHRWVFLNLFAESAPKLIALIQKAAGIKAEKVEYEYGVQTTDHTGQAFDPGEYGWVSTVEGAEILLQDRLDRWLERNVDWTAKIVKRRKAGEVEDV